MANLSRNFYMLLISCGVRVDRMLSADIKVTKLSDSTIMPEYFK
jgi:hypothetical protein